MGGKPPRTERAQAIKDPQTLSYKASGSLMWQKLKHKITRTARLQFRVFLKVLEIH